MIRTQASGFPTHQTHKNISRLDIYQKKKTEEIRTNNETKMNDIQTKIKNSLLNINTDLSFDTTEDYIMLAVLTDADLQYIKTLITGENKQKLIGTPLEALTETQPQQQSQLNQTETQENTSIDPENTPTNTPQPNSLVITQEIPEKINLTTKNQIKQFRTKVDDKLLTFIYEKLDSLDISTQIKTRLTLGWKTLIKEFSESTLALSLAFPVIMPLLPTIFTQSDPEEQELEFEELIKNIKTINIENSNQRLDEFKTLNGTLANTNEERTAFNEISRSLLDLISNQVLESSSCWNVNINKIHNFYARHFDGQMQDIGTTKFADIPNQEDIEFTPSSNIESSTDENWRENLPLTLWISEIAAAASIITIAYCLSLILKHAISDKEINGFPKVRVPELLTSPKTSFTPKGMLALLAAVAFKESITVGFFYLINEAGSKYDRAISNAQKQAIKNDERNQQTLFDTAYTLKHSIKESDSLANETTINNLTKHFDPNNVETMFYVNITASIKNWFNGNVSQAMQLCSSGYNHLETYLKPCIKTDTGDYKLLGNQLDPTETRISAKSKDGDSFVFSPTLTTSATILSIANMNPTIQDGTINVMHVVLGQVKNKIAAKISLLIHNGATSTFDYDPTNALIVKRNQDKTCLYNSPEAYTQFESNPIYDPSNGIQACIESTNTTITFESTPIRSNVPDQFEYILPEANITNQSPGFGRACYFDSDQSPHSWLSSDTTRENSTFLYPINVIPGTFQPTGITEEVSKIFGNLNTSVSTEFINDGNDPTQPIASNYFVQQSKNEQNYGTFVALCIVTVLVTKYIITGASELYNLFKEDTTQHNKTQGNLIAVVANDLKNIETSTEIAEKSLSKV